MARSPELTLLQRMDRLEKGVLNHCKLMRLFWEELEGFIDAKTDQEKGKENTPPRKRKRKEAN